jgi:hypothetical protein
MKIDKILIIFIIIGCMLAAGYIIRSMTNPEVITLAQPETAHRTNVTTPDLPEKTNPVPDSNYQVSRSGQVLVSIGGYNAQLPVYIDHINSGNVTRGEPLDLNLTEGPHVLSVCAGMVCETVDVDVKSGVRTSIDFEKRLNNDLPQGVLRISLGNFPATLPVFIDDTQVDVLSPGQQVNLTLDAGNHTVKLCDNKSCVGRTVDVQPSALISLDFEDQLEKNTPHGSLSISIGGFDADLPVFVDGIAAGNISLGKPLNLDVSVGNHTVSTCVGKICEKEDIQVLFAKQTTVDFGERLKKDVEFSTPAVRIVKYSLSGSTMTVNVEFINPDNVDHSITATVSCVYSFTDYENLRKNDVAKATITQTVNAGGRVIRDASLSLSAGSNIITNIPVITDVKTI